MATKNKINRTEVDVTDFIHSYLDDDKKKADRFELINLMAKWSEFEPKMWGLTIIGFGSYHYKYPSGHEGDTPIIGFSPRKLAFSMYVFSSTEENKLILPDLGKFKMEKVCIYIKKLADMNIPTLEKLCKSTIGYISTHYECACRER